MLDKLKNIFRSMGGSNAVVYIIDRFFLLFGGKIRLRKYYIMAQPIRPMTRLKLSGTKFEIKTVSRDGFLHLLQDRLSAMEIHERFDQDAGCYVVFEGDSVVGYLWSTNHQYQESEDRSLFVLDERMVWDFDVYIEPRYRFTSAFIQLWNYANKQFEQASLKYTISRVLASNYRSLSSHRRLGAHSVFWLLYLTIFNLQITISDKKPFLGIAIKQCDMPIYDINYSQVKKLFE